MPKKNNEIEVLRAFAILLTLWEHHRYYVLPWLVDGPLLLDQAWGGVQLFFVISGFLVTQTLVRTLDPALKHLGESPLSLVHSIQSFYLRRCFRILPAAYFTLFGAFALSLFFPFLGPLASDNSLWRNTFAAATFTLNYKMAADGNDLFGWFWSLCVEEHFYLVLPLFLFFVRSTGRRIVFSLVGIFVVVTLLRPLFVYLGKPEYPYLRVVTHLNVDFLLAGCLIFFLSTQAFYKELMPRFLIERKLLTFFANSALVAILWIAPAALGKAETVKMPLMLASCFGLVFLASFRNCLISPVFNRSDLLYWFSSRSYSLYLMNVLCYFFNRTVWETIAVTYGFPLAQTPVAAIGVTLSAFALIAVSSELCYRWIELPFQKKGRDLSDRLMARAESVEESTHRPRALKRL